MGLLLDGLREIAADDDFVAICPILLEPGRPDLIVVTGENAGGKTFVASYLSQIARRDHEAEGKLEIMDIGMRRRTDSGIVRGLMFGDEAWESTGQISLKVVLGGIRTCRGRENDHVLILDEPDIGLSESYRGALGELLADFADPLPERTVALVVVTHSREIVERLMPLGPTCVRVGDDVRPTKEWLQQGPLPRSMADVEKLQETALTRFRALTALIKARRESRKSDGPSP